MQSVLKTTTKEDQKIAKSSILKLRKSSQKIISTDRKYAKIKIQEKGEFLKIPKKALSLLFDILNNMAEGKSITIIPSDTELSTQQAADILKVSRPHLVKLLEDGKLAFTKVGTHRRIKIRNLMDYQENLRKNRRKQLDALTEQAQELNLGY
ncbi:MAG: excisionase family DNA-binding protein [Ginsengibacter sp.]